MLTQKSTVSKKLKKTLATALPVIALSGFLPTAIVVESALAGNEVKKEALAKDLKAEGEVQLITPEQRAELKSQLLAEGKTEAEAEAQIEEMLAKPKNPKSTK
ncbi:MAG: hypothetical protein ACRBEE_01255 [Arenicella sp.]